MYSPIHRTNSILNCTGITIYGNGNTINGSKNTIYGDYNSINGNCNSVDGDDNAIHGTGNTVKGNNNVVQGNSNTVNGKGNSVIGQGNVSNGTFQVPQNGYSLVNIQNVNGVINSFNTNSIGSVGDGAVTYVAQFNKPSLSNIKKVPDEMKDEPQSVSNGEKECLICFERSIKTVIVDCGHSVYCVSCSREHASKDNATCPVCRKVITQVIRVFNQ